jgi:tripartite-type tricarboxylate transporter receptor subunit TctC
MRARQPRTRTSAWTGSALAALTALATPAAALRPRARPTSNRGKTVKIIVGFGVGGGYDTYARMLAPYLREQLKTTVIVENQPGAGGLSALNRLYAAPPTGCN